jgi:hypothetical protein
VSEEEDEDVSVRRNYSCLHIFVEQGEMIRSYIILVSASSCSEANLAPSGPDVATALSCHAQTTRNRSL